jgi:hypothetical protein
MAAKVSETSERAYSMPQRRRIPVRSIAQPGLAALYLATAAMLTSKLLSTSSNSVLGRVGLAGLVALMLLLAFVHLVIFGLGLRLRKKNDRPAS